MSSQNGASCDLIARTKDEAVDLVNKRFKHKKKMHACVLTFQDCSVKIVPGDPLWKVLARMAQRYDVQVRKTGICSQGELTPWTGKRGSPESFKRIHFTPRSTNEMRKAA